MKYSTEERLSRLLAMIPWIVAHEGPQVKVVCERFGITAAEVAADIALLYLCGLHPYTPDLLIEADIRDGRVWVSYADYFSRPLRLTPVEGLGLLTAAQTLLAVPGTDPAGPLATGLAKLAASLGADEAIKVDLGAASDAVIETLRSARDAHQQVAIDYLSLARNERAVRTIEPAHVFLDTGEWYVSGWCHLAGDERTFRVDRIASATIQASPWQHAPAEHPPGLFTRAPTGGTVTLELGPTDRWVLEQYPTLDTTELPHGGVRVVLAVTDDAWLDRLVLRLSLDAVIVSAPPAWPGLGAAAASVLSRYP
jgi:proteasome accessory factor C